MKVIQKILAFFFILILFNCGEDLTYQEKVDIYNYHIKKADSLNGLEEFEEAIKHANSALSLTDTLSQAFIEKGKACYEKGWLETAEENFDEAIEIEGPYSKVFKLRALVFLKTNDSDFLDDIDLYLENYGDDEEALELKRNYLESNEDYTSAIEEYSLAISKNPENLDFLIKRGSLFERNNDYKEALIDYETILKLAPENELAVLKKKELEAIISENSNKNTFALILTGCYFLYLPLSFFVFKPIVRKKAKKHVGGDHSLGTDPLIWALPLVLLATYWTLWYLKVIPNF